MNVIDQYLFDRLRNSFRIFFSHGLLHSLLTKPDEADVLQAVVNLQAALEILIKMYLLQRKGWKCIVAVKHHGESESEIIAAIQAGTIKTNPYYLQLREVVKIMEFDDKDKALLNEFQSIRNQALHLGCVNPSTELPYKCILVVVRVVHRLEWQNSLEYIDQYMSNSLRSLLGDSLYSLLISSPNYVNEAIDRAFDYASDKVKFCPECNNQSWVFDDSSESSCLVCGYRGGVDAYGFIDCQTCRTKDSFIYDRLNIQINNSINGFCCKCRVSADVSLCRKCGMVNYGVCGCGG